MHEASTTSARRMIDLDGMCRWAARFVVVIGLLFVTSANAEVKSVHVGVLIDGSAAGSDFKVGEALGALGESLGKGTTMGGDLLGIWYTAAEEILGLPMTPVSGDDRKIVISALRNVSKKSHAVDAAGALGHVTFHLSGFKENGVDAGRIVVILTAGPDVGDEAGLAGAIAEASAIGVAVHAVALGDSANMDLLRKLAGAAGGQVYKANDAVGLSDVMVRLAVNIDRAREKKPPLTEPTTTAKPKTPDGGKDGGDKPLVKSQVDGSDGTDSNDEKPGADGDAGGKSDGGDDGEDSSDGQADAGSDSGDSGAAEAPPADETPAERRLRIRLEKQRKAREARKKRREERERKAQEEAKANGESPDDDESSDDDDVVTKASSGTPAWVWYAAGGGGGFIFLLILILIIVKVRRGRRGRAEGSDDSDESAPSFDPAAHFGGGAAGGASGGGSTATAQFSAQVDGLESFSMSSDTPAFLIGRKASNDVVLPGAGCSGFHAELRWRNGQLIIVDKGSTNGTYVNDQRVSEQPLETGDIVRFNDLAFRVGGSTRFTEGGDDAGGNDKTRVFSAADIDALAPQPDPEPEMPAPQDRSVALNIIYCIRHKNRISAKNCDVCTRPYCSECLMEVNAHDICPKCRAAGYQ
ncbi:MAG: hypothetical protein ACI9OJ_004290 [Myxococcota bacterium]|jgi:hypothetical protein